MITVPPGWHVAPFSDTQDGIATAGVQLSNVPLPPPAVIPGYPVQVLGRALPAHGIGLTITADTDTGSSDAPVAVLPLPYPDRWAKSSSGPRMRGSAGGSHVEVLWFRIGSTVFDACAKIGPWVTSADRAALAAAIRSIR
jgi:hypothetical protein